MNITIDTGVFDTPGATLYFTKADHRILCGCRATLEMLGIPLPDWAKRKPTGPKPGKAIMAAYRGDNPETLYEATMRKSSAAASRLPKKVPAKENSSDAPPSLGDRIAALKATLQPERPALDASEDDPLNLPPEQAWPWA